jgi:hypothetical protein
MTADTALPISRSILEEALLKIADRWKLFWVNAADYKRIAIIEGCAHELAHALDLGRSFEPLIQEMAAKKANKHEASALRIEIVALATLGIRVSPRRLHASANWEDLVSYDTALGTPSREQRRPVNIPPRAQLQTPLTRHERRCVRRFVTMVAREVKRLRKVGSATARTSPRNDILNGI